MIAHEIFHFFFRGKYRGKREECGLGLDTAEAYTHVEWSILEEGTIKERIH